ncbi:mechanosensitive ion channel family protein [Fimbriimonas ginsengisoli]|uniref:Small-conductance mechanosensitive channel n=1 Tax=Fimbriimonas ginsengisoli Gsoil 348 TaxID=661478 RepID=A0A068NS83_FIMGI|nr:mechanosensitive ion channel family protein [Fimbriimonas ginsengisoli]AIE86306.1 Small-conductance mechanosensitive channel [Fimbriimonas ginsengisoli Gsoil 348]
MTWPDWVLHLPAPLRWSFLGVAAWQAIGVLVLVLAALVAALFGRIVAVRLLRFRSRFLPNRLTLETERAIRRAIGILSGVAVSYLILGELVLPSHLDGFGRSILCGIAIVAFGMLAYSMWDAVCDDIASRATGSDRAERLLVPMARKFVRALIVLVAFLVGATMLFNADVRGILASLGIGGLVVALAAKDSVENVFGSLTILFDMPFAIGDWVRIDKTEGIVEEINLRSTRVRTFEDTVITLPNANLIRASVENVSSRRNRRQKLDLRLSYDTGPEALDAFCRDLRAWLERQPKTVREKTIVDIQDFGEPSFGVLVQCHFDAKTQAEELDLRHLLGLEILRLRDKHKVMFAAHPRPEPTAKH